jgi:hypothetical protein
MATGAPPAPRSGRRGRKRAEQASAATPEAQAAAEDLARLKAERATSLRDRLSAEAKLIVHSARVARQEEAEAEAQAQAQEVVTEREGKQAREPPLAPLPSTGLLDLETLGSALPPEATHGPGRESRPFVCGVRIEVAGLTEAQAVEQGEAVVAEVQANFLRGPVATSGKVLRAGAQHWVMWKNLGSHSIRLEPNKSNCIVWLNKAWALKSELDGDCSWPAQRALIETSLPHGHAWVRVLEHARDDGGIDIKDDCRLDDRSARCHQDGNNSVNKGREPLVRLAVNVSSRASGRSLDYLRISSDGALVDGAEREALLVHSVSQHLMWHGAAQTISAYIKDISPVCHGSSAGTGPCLKRLITVFRLPDEHPLSCLTAVQRLHRIGISVYAVDPRHKT